MTPSRRGKGTRDYDGALKLRIAGLAETLRGSLWFLPTLMIVAASLLGAFLISLESPVPKGAFLYIFLPRTVDGARAVLQVVVGSVVTVTSVVFSLTLVALQIAATNYSPRILRTFLRDRGTQSVLGVFLGTFAYSFLVLQNTRSVGDGQEHWAPQIAMVLLPLLALASLAALVFFIHHVTQAIRVESILRDVLTETLETISRLHGGDWSGSSVGGGVEGIVSPEAHPVRALKSGFIQHIAPDTLLPHLERQRAVAALRLGVGDHVVKGTTLAWVWSEGGDAAVASPLDLDDLTGHLNGAVHSGNERTMRQDAAFGIRQLVDVAVRALSAGVNDPNTAVVVIAHLTVVYCTLARSELGDVSFEDRRGKTRLFIPRLELDDYLHMTTQQIGHYGARDSMVLERLLVMLTEVKSVSQGHHDQTIGRHISRILEEGQNGQLLPGDLQAVEEAARRAHEVKLPTHTSRSG